jgi:hypothetical protein
MTRRLAYEVRGHVDRENASHNWVQRARRRDMVMIIAM